MAKAPLSNTSTPSSSRSRFSAPADNLILRTGDTLSGFNAAKFLLRPIKVG